LKLWRIMGCAVPSHDESQYEGSVDPRDPKFWFIDN
jgi:hypothetical protein